MLSIIKSFGLNGLKGYLVNVEVDLSMGMPSYETVGLPDATVKESKERIRAAIKNSQLKYPALKTTINLAPADTKKEGALYDLPIAVGLLSSSEQLDKEMVEQYAFIGELGLDGCLKKMNGLLPILIGAMECNVTKIFIPKQNEFEASYIEGLEIYAVENLNQIVNFFNGSEMILPVETRNFNVELQNNYIYNDFKFVKGQAKAKRALEIAAAGGHNVMMIGPPGAGKTMLAKCFASILPDLTFEEALECTKIHSVAGVLDNKEGIITRRPFRTPHHTATLIALTGGGNNAKPGEISLAHNGVLFLDELPEYNRHTIETLRQPLEDGVVTVSRNKMTVEYPANFIMLASMNPCPCGFYGSSKHVCKCSPSQIYKYLNKLSGPLLDRIDMHIEVEGVTYDELSSQVLEESSCVIKERVNKARKVQVERFEGTHIHSNSAMLEFQIKEYCKLDKESEEILEEAFDNLNLSARGHNRILKVARTIADLDGSTDIKIEHIIEAIGYRSLDKKFMV